VNVQSNGAKDLLDGTSRFAVVMKCGRCGGTGRLPAYSATFAERGYSMHGADLSSSNMTQPTTECEMCLKGWDVQTVDLKDMTRALLVMLQKPENKELLEELLLLGPRHAEALLGAKQLPAGELAENPNVTNPGPPAGWR